MIPFVRTESRNIYRIPFDGEPNVQPAPFHYESFWQRGAVDFALPIGTPILAAADGIVTSIQDGNGEGRLEQRFLTHSNTIVILHKYGESSYYVHLRKGIVVKWGQKVKEGDLIGYSGISGFASYPHLHFALMGYTGLLTIPPRFQVNGDVKVLVSPRE